MARPRFKKRLGQHHLVEGAACRPLVEFLAPAGRLVVEVGPGGGVLTRRLLAAGARVVALEVDPEWGLALGSRLRSPRLRLIVGDALELSWDRLPEASLVAGNLPYNVATPLIERILTRGAGVARAGFLVQLEVAERLVAAPGSGAYGSLSVLTAACAEATILGRVPRRLFRPRPAVDGAFVGLRTRRPPVPRAELPALARTVRLAFGLRRKTLRNALAAGWGRPAAERALERLGLGARTRAEALPLATFVELHRLRPPGTAGDPPPALDPRRA